MPLKERTDEELYSLVERTLSGPPYHVDRDVAPPTRHRPHPLAVLHTSQQRSQDELTMVRNARFSFDDEENREFAAHPSELNDIDDFDFDGFDIAQPLRKPAPTVRNPEGSRHNPDDEPHRKTDPERPRSTR